MKHRWIFSSFLAWICVVSETAPVFATAPKLTGTTPAGGQRGTELEVKLNGSRLHDAKEIVFYSPGFEVLSLDASKTNSLKARLKIAADCQLGEHYLRVRTATGISDVRTFYVGAYTNVAEAEPNNEVGKAQKISVPCTINGSAGQEDIDYFAVTLQKGQLLSVEVEGMRLGRAMFDPYLAVRDESGKLLAASDDTALLQQDPTTSLVAPETGKYVIEVRETSYSGTADSPYRLHVGAFPRPLAAYPAGGRTGETLRVKFVGALNNTFEQEVPLPASSSEKFPIFARQKNEIAPSPNWLRVSLFPNVLESDTNHSREEATPTSALPIAFNGIISTNKEVDWFRFPGKKGEALEVNVFARRLRSPLDSVIEICDHQGKVLAQNDDAAGPDSSLKFSPPQDGEYYISITDQLGKGERDYVYRIEVLPAVRSLALTTPQVARNDSQTRQFVAVPRGNRFAALIAAKRGNVSGPLRVDLPGLPAGVKMSAEVMPAKQDALPVIFEATPDAPLEGKLLDLVADSTNGVRGHFKQEVEFIYGQNNQVYYGARLDKLMVAVTEPAPFKISISEPRVPLVQSGTMDLQIVAERQPGFDEPINIKMLWNPPGVGSQPEVTIPKGSNSVIYPLNASSSAETNAWKIAVIGTATVEGGPVYVSSQLAKIEVAEPFLTGKIETLTVRPGEKARLICKLDQKTPFAGKAIVRLVGLPDKVTSEPREITSEDKEVAFDLNVDPSCPPKSTRVLLCNVLIQKDGDLIAHNIAGGGHLRIVPPKKIAAAENTRVTAKTASAK